MSVRRAQQEIDSEEFGRWIAFYELEPWGNPVEDLRVGAQLSMVANINRDRKKAPEPFGLLDFVPWSKDRPEAKAEPILLADPKAQTALLCATLFGGK
ncbi:phage tail assembly protein T [Paraburkholderia tropica]|uniref:phage tail assembly protein T n=1 Tax=Paraburkholderia tropica TaxID=92647 RepID=UPI002AB73AE6|nr:hypothetical protein [Paraburkholderia tropica]